MVLRLALAPPRSSVLPPGAGDEADKADKTEPKGPKQGPENAEERYVGQAAVVDGKLDAPAVGGHDDRNVPRVPAVEQAQCDLPIMRVRLAGGAV